MIAAAMTRVDFIRVCSCIFSAQASRSPAAEHECQYRQTEGEMTMWISKPGSQGLVQWFLQI